MFIITIINIGSKMYDKSEIRLLDVNKVPSQPKRRKKITLVFDEEKRREFLGGFRQRKLERKRKAQEQLQQQLKEERKKIKQETRERYKKLVSQRNIPELEELLSRKEYDMKDHTVSILELNIADLKEGSKWIGQKKVEEESEEEEDNDENEHSSDDDDDNDIIGMSLQEKQKLPASLQDSKINNQEKKSLKDVKHELKKAALKRVRKSKAFQQKQKMEQQKNRKQSRRESYKAKNLRHSRKYGKQIKKKSGRR